VFQNSVLRKIFGPTKEEKTGGLRHLQVGGSRFVLFTTLIRVVGWSRKKWGKMWHARERRRIHTQFW